MPRWKVTLPCVTQTGHTHAIDQRFTFTSYREQGIPSHGLPLGSGRLADLPAFLERRGCDMHGTPGEREGGARNGGQEDEPVCGARVLTMCL